MRKLLQFQFNKYCLKKLRHFVETTTTSVEDFFARSNMVNVFGKCFKKHVIDNFFKKTSKQILTYKHCS